jgi:tRNA nucleotidyltransferase (CCA-adding enzyme)
MTQTADPLNSLTASDIMSKPVVSTSPDAPIARVIHLLHRHNVSGIPVVDEGRVVGMISEADIEKRRMNRETGDHVYDVMSDNVVYGVGITPLSEIAYLMRQHHVNRIPIYEDGRLAGIVTRSDLIASLPDGQPRKRRIN